MKEGFGEVVVVVDAKNPAWPWNAPLPELPGYELLRESTICHKSLLSHDSHRV